MINIKNIFSLKKGAMFGIDARVTLAVTSIAAFVVGVNTFADFDRKDKQSANADLALIKSATLSYYKDKYTVPTVAQLVAEKYIDTEYSIDRWGNAYSINSVNSNKTILNSEMNVKYFVISSNAKNAILDTAMPANLTAWVDLEPSSDDLILKFDTLDVEKQIAEIEANQITVIKYLLEGYIKEQQILNAAYCANSDHQKTSKCDVNEDGVYAENEELNLNYMPKNIDDTYGKYYMTENGTFGTDNKFKSGYINASLSNEYNMYVFMALIGGLPDYVISPRNLVLNFNSNKYNNNQAPYYAEVWYDEEVTVF